jgi:molybdate transport system regulatory protein
MFTPNVLAQIAILKDAHKKQIDAPAQIIYNRAILFTLSYKLAKMSTSFQKLLNKGNYKVSGRLWIESSGRKFFGPGPIELLELIEKTGSINKAAKKMKMSYKKATKIVKNINSSFSKPAIISASGGEKGGGSTISNEARQAIAHYNALRARFEAFMEKESKKLK